MAFSAAAPDAAAPASQTVTATFGADVANVAVIHSGPAIDSVTSVLNGRTAQITIVPSTPSTVGAGILTGTVAITGYFCADATCTRVEAGNSQTVDVSYQVSPVVNFVAPYVATSGVSHATIIRGAGFSGFTLRGVTFGTTAATAMAVISDTEISATLPALAAGTYAVGLDIPTHQGAVPTTATLVVADAPAYAAQTLAYPAAASAIRSLIYDAERGALLVATADGNLLRYPYAAGAWGAPASVAVTQLQDLALSIDGAQLLAATQTGITPVDPSALTLGAAVPATPALVTDSFVKNVAVANNNLAIVTTGIAKSQATTLYTYAAKTATFGDTGAVLNNATPATPRNGATVLMVTGDPSLTAAPTLFAYSPSANTVSATLLALNQNDIAPAMDRDGTRLALNGLNVYGGDFALLGTLPATTRAVAFKPDGTRAFTYDASSSPVVMSFDTSVTQDGAALPQVGAAVALAGDPGTGAKMTISPDGGTLFIAGGNQIVIQPTPP